MKNVYKWRITNAKYAYLISEGNNRPFVYYKSSNERYYGKDEPLISEYVDENEISRNVSKIINEGIYKQYLDALIILCKDCDDEDVKNLLFLDDISKYFNIENDECVEEASVAKCEGYETILNLSAVTVESFEEARLDLNVDKNQQAKTITYNVIAYIPKGEKGADGIAIPCRGPQGIPGKTPVVTAQLEGVETIKPPASAYVILTTGQTPTSDLDLKFKFGIPEGKKGDQGLQGPSGKNGLPCEFGEITGYAYTIDSDLPPSLTITKNPEGEYKICQNPDPDASGRTIQVVDLGLALGIPKGEKGEIGEAGPPAIFSNITATVVGMLPAKTPSEVTAMTTSDVTSNSYNLSLQFKLPWPEKGDKGDPGDAGTCEGCEGGGGDEECELRNIYDFQEVDILFNLKSGANPIGTWREDWSKVATCRREIGLKLQFPEDFGYGGVFWEDEDR